MRNVDLAATRCLVNSLAHSREVVGVNALQHPFQGRSDARVVFENAKGFVRPVKVAGGRRPAETACVTQMLCFRQIGFAAAQPLFGLLGFIDVNSQAIPLDDSPLSVAHWLAASVVPTKFAVRPTQAMYSLVGSPSLNCVLEGLQSFW